MNEEVKNNENNNKQKVAILIGLVTLLIAVLGATYAYFQISTNNESSNTTITGKTPPKSLVTLKQGTSNLHLNISASDMSLANANNEYYATDAVEKSYEENEQDGTKTIAEIELTGGEETTKYNCTAKLTVSKITEPDADKDTMIDVLHSGDMILQFKGNIISEKLDLSELKENNPKEYNLSFKVTGNKVENIQAYIKLLNKNESQNYLAGKKLNIDINTSELKCNVYIEHPTITRLRENDVNNTLSENIIGGMYRYQGTSSVPNWICFGTKDKGECTSGTTSVNTGVNKYMYRIIGITEEGQLYLLKEVVLKEEYERQFFWNSKGDISDCLSNSCEWPNVDLFKRINGTSNGTNSGANGDTNLFLGTNEHQSPYEYLTQGTDWYNLIEEHEWMYGDTNQNYNDSNTYNGDYMYAIETGQANTTHYIGTKEDITLETYKWPETNKVKSKTSLLYMYDYLYAYPGGNPGNSANVAKSWIHFDKDGYNSSLAWETLSTRWGIESTSDTTINVHRVHMFGEFSAGEINVGAYCARPVFYLSSSAKIASGDGTKSNPYILEI